MLHAVIMAGGSGTRFWPASRRDRPKQFLRLAADRPLLRLTYERLAPLVAADRMWVVTADSTAEVTRQLLPELPADHVLGEPEGRDTAACVGYAAHVLRRIDPEAVCVVLPADHIISEAGAFRSAMAAGARQVEERGGLLTFGLRPKRAETGFGYLRLGAEEREIEGHVVHVLERFVEKPDAAHAEGYLADGGYLWNSGMFAWRVGDLLAEIDRQLPELAAGLERIGRALGGPSADAELAAVYPRLPRVSLDYGIMEGALSRWTIPVDFGWSDVGSWSGLREALAGDEEGNVSQGRVVAVGASQNTVISEGPVVGLIGVDHLVVVATQDAVLVVPESQAQEVKSVVAELQDKGWTDVL